MAGKLSHEIEVRVPASEAWELYGTLRLGKLIVEEAFPGIIEEVEVIEGNGGTGTIVKIVPGNITDHDHQDHAHESIFFFFKYLIIILETGAA